MAGIENSHPEFSILASLYSFSTCKPEMNMHIYLGVTCVSLVLVIQYSKSPEDQMADELACYCSVVSKVLIGQEALHSQMG